MARKGKPFGSFISAIALAAIAVSFVLAADTAYSRETVDRVVAVVNGDPITLHELRQVISAIPDVEPAKVLEELINQKLLDQEVEKQGIYISEEEVNKIVQKRMEELNLSERELVEQLERDGLTLEKLKENIGQSLTKVKIIRGGVKVTNEDMLNFYNQNIGFFVEHGEVRISRIFLPFPVIAEESDRALVIEEATKLKARADSGEDFAELAKKYSREEQAENGGDLGYFAENDLISQYQEELEKMKPGDISPVIETDMGCHILKLVERKQGGTLEFDKVKNKIYMIVYDNKLKDHIDVLITDLKSKARIERKL